MTKKECSRREFILSSTAILSPPLVPEVSLRLATEAVPLWQKTEEELGEIGLPPPFWAFAWAGGQALARYILDRPETVRGKRIVDLASGSGLVAIAALKAGATRALAADIDEFSAAAIALNAGLNDVALAITTDDLLASEPPGCDVILVGDLFYEQSLAARLLEWLSLAQQRGTQVMIGDPGRSYLPKQRLTQLAIYSVPVTRDLEDAEIKQGAVWTLAP
ncbi:MAG: methyltransferase [Rhizobiales bacterium]|nr:methyltransferase [Hyphomicrobiales bacterium]